MSFDFSSRHRLGFQSPATPIAEGIIDLHHSILFWVVVILIIVCIMLCVIYITVYKQLKNPEKAYYVEMSSRILVMSAMIHGTFLEILWTITPSVILVLIALPSFALLYSIDEVIDPEETVKIIGNQWYRTYETSKKLKPILGYNQKKEIEIEELLTTKVEKRKEAEIGLLRACAKSQVVWEEENNVLSLIETKKLIIGRLALLKEKFSKEFVYRTAEGMRAFKLVGLGIADNSSVVMKGTEVWAKLRKLSKFCIGVYNDVAERGTTVKGLALEKNKSGNYKNFDSYMIPVTELSRGDLRLLEVDNPLSLETRKHIRFLITSSDVLHSFAVPSLGIKVDAVPGRLNQISTFITREGVFYGQCSELCGVNHGFMPIKIISIHLRRYEL